MKTERTTPILIIVFAQVLRTEPSPVSVLSLSVTNSEPGDNGGDDDSTPPVPLFTMSDEELVKFMDDMQRYNYEIDAIDKFDISDEDKLEGPDLDSRNRLRNQWIQGVLDSWNRDAKRRNVNVDKQLKAHSKKKLHKILGVAGFALFILTCVITFICGILACCGKLDKFCFRRSRDSIEDENPEISHSEGLLDYYPEFDSPPAYSDLYCDNYKHECAHLNPETEAEGERCREPESPPPAYTEVV